jgi:hypothetical protein
MRLIIDNVGDHTLRSTNGEMLKEPDSWSVSHFDPHRRPETIMPTVKFVDDITVTEIINSHSSSQMQTAADPIPEWLQRNLININVKKTKEYFLVQS